ncbi:MAG: Asp-tRNA(Asn)/Glu-tRNA(Gln) amidotransferase subunit GatC [Alphaproteobacteria bacterium]
MSQSSLQENQPSNSKKLGADDVKKIARLARLRVEESELLPLASELNHILQWVEQLQEVDTTNVKAFTSVGDYHQRLREDVVNLPYGTKELLANAPEQAEGFFVVAKVVE